MTYLEFLDLQPVCEHCVREFPEDVADGCAASQWQSTGPCRGEGCSCYGTEVDGGLCEACYLSTK